MLRSNERPSYSAVIGETFPLSGLIGRIRRFAFRCSESRYANWLPLLLADRINVIEGFADDYRKDKKTNIFAERGTRSQLKYGAVGIIKKVAITTIVVGVLISICRKKDEKKETISKLESVSFK